MASCSELSIVYKMQKDAIGEQNEFEVKIKENEQGRNELSFDNLKTIECFYSLKLLLFT